MDGALMEIGPYRLKDDSHLQYNDGAWDEFSNLLFIDNPVGTGFSYANTDSYVHELTEMANQIRTFLTEFYKMFPEYENNDVSSIREDSKFNADRMARSILLGNHMPASIFHTWHKQSLIAMAHLQTANSGICRVF